MNIKENNEMFKQYTSSLINEAHDMTNEVDQIMSELKRLKEAGQEDMALKKLQELESSNPALHAALKQALLRPTGPK